MKYEIAGKEYDGKMTIGELKDELDKNRGFSDLTIQQVCQKEECDCFKSVDEILGELE